MPEDANSIPLEEEQMLTEVVWKLAVIEVHQLRMLLVHPNEILDAEGEADIFHLRSGALNGNPCHGKPNDIQKTDDQPDQPQKTTRKKTEETCMMPKHIPKKNQKTLSNPIV